MINIGKILRRSWQILWSYRVLWIFGILLALTTAGLNNNSNFRNQASQTNPNNLPGNVPEGMREWMRQLTQWFTQNVQPLFSQPREHIGTFVLIGAIVLLIVLLLGTLAGLVRYPTETAVIRMVDEYENSGNKLNFRQGWRLGWTRRAFRLWLIDLILALPALIFVLLIVAAGIFVAFNVTSTFRVTNSVSVVAAIGLAFVSLFFLIVVVFFLGLLRNFFARVAVLEDQGVQASLRQGWAMFKRHWKSAGLMWLVMVGIGIGMGIAGLVLFFLLIPAYLIMLLPAAFTAIIPALVAFGISSLFTSAPLTWIIAVLAALPFFFIVLFIPLFLFSGWYKIYESNNWTLTYREIKALESLTPALPVEGAPGNPVS